MEGRTDIQTDSSPGNVLSLPGDSPVYLVPSSCIYHLSSLLIFVLKTMSRWFTVIWKPHKISAQCSTTFVGILHFDFITNSPNLSTDVPVCCVPGTFNLSSMHIRSCLVWYIQVLYCSCALCLPFVPAHIRIS